MFLQKLFIISSECLEIMKPATEYLR